MPQMFQLKFRRIPVSSRDNFQTSIPIVKQCAVLRIFDTDPDPGKNDTDSDPGKKGLSTRKIFKKIYKNANFPWFVCFYYLSINYLNIFISIR